jgi:adenine/guanine phosphoribosyltransferase-like PRPP-binding protein
MSDKEIIDDTSKAERAHWRDFPPVIANEGLGGVKREPEYVDAKKGDWRAALTMMDRLIKDETVEKVRELIKDRKDVKIVPVLAAEETGSNKIPLASAAILAGRLGLEVETDIIQREKVYRTNSKADHRLAHSPSFVGEVEKGRDYLVLDDTLTTGGTLASLRGHIENRGGHVLGAVAMTAHPGALDIAVKPKMLDAIEKKHGSAMNDYWKEEFGYDIDKLTQGEAGHLKAASSVDAIRDRIAEARNAHRLRIDERGNTEEKGGAGESREDGLRPQSGPYREKADDFRTLSTRDLLLKYREDKAILDALAVRGISEKFADQLPLGDQKRQFLEKTINRLADNIEHGSVNNSAMIKNSQDNSLER